MTQFRYAAVRDDGERVSGTIEGGDRAMVIGRLSEQGLHPIDVAPLDQQTEAGRIFAFGGKAIGAREIAIFTRELAWLLHAGITLNSALDIMGKETFSRVLAGIIATLRTEIRKGRSFHEVLGEARVFSPYFVNMVRVGEASGTLASVLDRIALTQERELRVRGRLQSALVYPAFLVCLSAGALVFIMVAVVPSIKDMIAGSGAPVPDSARAVIGVSDWLVANGQFAAIAGALVLLGAALLFSTQTFRKSGISALGWLPIIGPILRLSAVLKFSRILGTLSAAGLNLPDSLRLIRPSTTDPHLVRAIGDMETALRRGDDFIAPLEQSKVFPGLLARMLRVGRETGNLTASLQQVSEILEDEFDRKVDRSLTLLGPIIILILSAFIAFVIMSLMGAVISINDLAL